MEEKIRKQLQHIQYILDGLESDRQKNIERILDCTKRMEENKEFRQTEYTVIHIMGYCEEVRRIEKEIERNIEEFHMLEYLLKQEK